MPSTIEFIRHIQQELQYIIEETSGINFEDFVTDVRLNKAIVRSLEIIGEASKRVPDAIRYRYNELDWKGFAGLRDVLIHQYWGIDYQLVWDAATDDVPVAKVWIDLIIELEKDLL
ncbi:HepT-like ribonuclease domain-containing protein [Larkinella humicola]|uniref:DUF86 domain-containing protein n=1 Tax=Larkinella humicola TaxID=2607654 RepID=A0A5N1JHE0_9BACT|nr:DUF86 domain-containing protein [Larkinella humicola]KAA9352751.1 DUF86 domain-containing protein [Larkinella humicola]